MQEKLNKKFDICYVMAKESIAFQKYPVLHELEEHHGVNLGQSYKTKDSEKTSPTTKQKTSDSNLLVRCQRLVLQLPHG